MAPEAQLLCWVSGNMVALPADPESKGTRSHPGSDHLVSMASSLVGLGSGKADLAVRARFLEGVWLGLQQPASAGW